MKQLFLGFLILFYSFTTVVAGENKPVTPETALRSYLQQADKTLKWEIQDQTNIDGINLYRTIFTSQQWRGIDWIHEMMILVPDIVEYNDALLFITGGRVTDGQPSTHQWTDDLVSAFSHVAKTNKAIVAIVWQVPNQPLYDNLTEDALISYTLHNYLNDKDYTWPLLFPMTRSAIGAMDVIQHFSKKELKKKVNYFVVSGASKRGWTTWLTGASDKRVKAIGPMVIDVLNMPVNVDYQKEVWGDYSIEIQDYVNLGIAQQLSSPGGNELVTMIDPYSYRKSLTMPKMIFMGTNDPYWPVDAVKNYIDSIPGNNFICYTPNAAHNLGDKKKAFTTLSAFFGITITNGNYPVCDYSISEENGKIILTVKSTPEILRNAVLWSSGSEDQDFRDEEWSGQSLDAAEKAEITVEIDYPSSGYKAFYVDLEYQAPFGGDYTQSTRMFVTTEKNLLLKNQ
ncbi:PhoPQ-activated pathogenicity-related family protein [Gaoshiqia sp. Z1-71]|uniref:PhoPQ-activated pathogenicity-related family protein n=1 Tax=Gaoshiqia hydrogeniformans TaxID=3290090 RepID=UPI003BF847A3